MAGNNTSVFGIYRNRIDLEHAVDTLRAEGFRSTDISVLFPDNEGTKDFAHEKHTKAPEGTTAGAATGAVLGGVLGWLTGIGALAIPGIGPFIAAGPIMAALAGAGVVGTVGGLTGALIGAGIPEYEAKRYEGRVREGGILLSVHCDKSEWVDKAKDVLERTGATDISSANEASAKSKRSDDIDIERPGTMDRPISRPNVPTAEDLRTTRRDPNNRNDPNYRPDRDLPSDPGRRYDPDLPPDSDTDLP
jgi:hypothetical protein